MRLRNDEQFEVLVCWIGDAMNLIWFHVHTFICFDGKPFAIQLKESLAFYNEEELLRL